MVARLSALAALSATIGVLAAPQWGGYHHWSHVHPSATLTVSATGIPPTPSASVVATSVAISATSSAAPVSATSSAAPVSATSSASSTPPTSDTNVLAATVDQAAYLNPHNTERAKHGAKALTWSTTLQKSAQAVANKCVFAHSGTAGVGENLSAGTGSFGPAPAIKLWTDEGPSYDPANPQYSHWTQVVWKATTQVGCAVASCDGIFPASYGKAQFHVCQYSPPGNVIGQFAANVQK